MEVGYVGGIVNSTEEYSGSGTTSLQSNTFNIPAGQIYCMFVLLWPKDYNKSAEYVSTAEKGISFNIQQA